MSSNEVTHTFVSKLRNSLEANTFVKLTLSKNAGVKKNLKNIFIRRIELKNHGSLSFTYRFSDKDEVRNYFFPEGIEEVSLLLGNDFLNADLFTLEKTISIRFSKKRIPKIFSGKAMHSQLPSDAHDRQKKRLISAEKSPYLHALSITNAEGKLLKSGQKKYRQINKYIEIIDKLLESHPLPSNASIYDFGSGKGYLTFALYDHLTNNLKLDLEITGIELRKNLVDFCNRISRETAYKGLHFIAKDINEFHPDKIDMLIALHACDIATDMAIAKGIQSNASIIVVAPCCHKQIRGQMNCQTDMQAILRHGILEERQAELITDGIRSLILEANGYKTQVFEFISTEHTPKNLMITAVKNKKNLQALKKVEAIKSQFGIEYHYLEKLLQ